MYLRCQLVSCDSVAALVPPFPQQKGLLRVKLTFVRCMFQTQHIGVSENINSPKVSVPNSHQILGA